VRSAVVGEKKKKKKKNSFVFFFLFFFFFFHAILFIFFSGNSDLVGRLSEYGGGSDNDDVDADAASLDRRTRRVQQQQMRRTNGDTASAATSVVTGESGMWQDSAQRDQSDGNQANNLAVLLQLFCDTSVDATFIVSEVGAIVTMNQAGLDLFGYQRWELVGRNVNMLMEPKIAKLHDSFLARYRRSRVRRIIGEARDGLLAMRKDGSLFRVLLKVHEYRDPSQVVYIGVIRDVSKANQASDYHSLLAKLVPPTIAQRLIAGEAAIADKYRATVGFIDICGYTKRTRTMAPAQIVLMLAEIFAQFDAHLDEFSCTRVKTIGDGYMFVSNLTSRISAHAVNGALFAKRCLDALASASDMILRKSMQKDSQPIVARAGVATGDVLAGVVPGRHIAFDLWGESVNLASRLESTAPTGRVLVCKRTRDESHYCLAYAAEPTHLNLKGFGEYDGFLLEGIDELHTGGGQPSNTKKTARIRAHEPHTPHAPAAATAATTSNSTPALTRD
jgi:PAS domain S-box-containing protein